MSVKSKVGRKSGTSRRLCTLEVLLLVAVQRDEDEEHRRETPHRGATVAQEGEWDTYDRHKADGHADIDEKVHEDAAGDAVSVDAGEGLAAPFGVIDDPPHQEDVEQDDK